MPPRFATYPVVEVDVRLPAFLTFGLIFLVLDFGFLRVLRLLELIPCANVVYKITVLSRYQSYGFIVILQQHLHATSIVPTQNKTNWGSLRFTLLIISKMVITTPCLLSYNNRHHRGIRRRGMSHRQPEGIEENRAGVWATSCHSTHHRL